MRPVFSFLLCAPILACAGGDTGRDDASATVTTVSASSSSTATDTATPTAPTTGTPTESGTGSNSESVSTTPGETTDTTGNPNTTGTSDPTATGSTGPVATDTSDSADTGSTTLDPSDSGTTFEPEACPCPEGLKVPLDDGIFVLSKTGALWKYFPADNKFTMLGPLTCEGDKSTFSMGVDRQGFAWVQFSDKRIRKVDITNVADCSDPGFVAMQDGIQNFGMAFVSNSADDKCDRIYGNHYNGVAMGKDASEFFSVDPMTLGLVQLGKSDYGLAEVTGTGDGRAFLFAGPDPADLVEVDKATGDTIATIPLPGVKTGGGFAFAFFAGDFYFFTDAESDMTSEVTHIDYDDSDKNGKQDITVVLQDAPLRIVGAGVSTCAPLVPQ